MSRLLALQQENSEAGQRMALQAPRFQTLAGKRSAAITGFNLFQTPKPTAARMAELIPPKALKGRILDPSAGYVRLVEPLSNIEAEWVLVEEERECYNALLNAVKLARKQAYCRDFLTLTPGDLGQFDAIVMNPPFKQGRDIKHIKHAVTFLKPGGRLVSLCYDGVRQNKILKLIVDTWEVLPEGSFKECGSGFINN